MGMEDIRAPKTREHELYQDILIKGTMGRKEKMPQMAVRHLMWTTESRKV